MANDSPSPWGEGRDEGGRRSNLLDTQQRRSCATTESQLEYTYFGLHTFEILKEAKLKEPIMSDRKFEDVVRLAQCWHWFIE
jgi:hypothetical protein